MAKKAAKKTEKTEKTETYAEMSREERVTGKPPIEEAEPKSAKENDNG